MQRAHVELVKHQNNGDNWQRNHVFIRTIHSRLEEDK